MTVHNMDISLNISSTNVETGLKTDADDNFILSLMRQKKGQEKSKNSTISKVKPDLVKDSGIVKKRVKQKHISAIATKKLKKSNKHDEVRSGNAQKKLKSKLQPTDTENKQSDQEVVKAPIRTDKNDTTNKSLVSKDDKDFSMPVISFTKVTQENFGKTLVAKKKKVESTDSKKTLASIFSKQLKDQNKDISLLSSSKEVKKDNGTSEEKVAYKNLDQSPSTIDKVNFTKEKKKKNIEKPKHEKVKRKEDHESKQIPYKSVGKISSLFGHNPEIPNIGQRLVKPIQEEVFAGTTFKDLNIHPFTISNLEQNMGITKMTIVQQKAIPQILLGKDVLVRSQTGSGKTLAYALPIVEFLHKVRPKLNRNSGLKALVVVPTKELALQTYECFLKLIKPFTWIVPGYLAGGEKRKAEKARLRKGCNILVGTPGRLLDHIKRTAALKLSDVRHFVLDEADRMFDMGYEKDISGIVSALKVSAPSESTGYDAMQMFRRNVKKIFTEEDIEEAEKNAQRSSEDSQNDQSLRTIIKKKKTKSESSDNETIEDGNKQRQEYHSSSDNDSADGEPFVRSKKSDKKNDSSTSKKDESPRKTDDATKEDSSGGQTGKQTILLSATLTQSVEKLAGLAMDRPVLVDAAKENLEFAGNETSDLNEDLVVPQSVTQSYVVTPPKLRMVTLSAYIAGKCQSHGQHKILIFMATQDMVDYHAEILSAVLTKPVDEDDDDSEPLVDVEFFKLHGNMCQKERTEVFKTFRQAKSGVLLCTDVAARGLDLPKVDCVVQYTGPTSARDYVHRIGRTARAGTSGSATIFLTPSEIDFVRMLESRRVRIKQEDMDDILDKLLGPLSKHSSVHGAAIALQSDFENMLLEDPRLRDKACKAYNSWIRFYSSYPREMREIFNRRSAHLGHYAKSFALRETPQRIGGIGKKLHEKDSPRQQHKNRLTDEKPDGESPFRKQRRRGDEVKMVGGSLLKRVRMLNTSEYDSGLEPAKKPKKS